jgi:hypothetical protein
VAQHLILKYCFLITQRLIQYSDIVEDRLRNKAILSNDS